MPLEDATRKLCSALFSKLDKNKDNVLDKEEVTKATKGMHSFMPPQVRWEWEEMDTDGDGSISRTEWLTFLGAKADLGDHGEGELLAAITRWCEHEAGLEEEAEAAEKVARALALKVAIHPENLHFFGLDWSQG